MPNPDSVSAVLEFIYLYTYKRKYSPSIREIAAACFLSTTETHRILTILKATEKISMEAGKSRTIRIIE